MFLSNLLLFLLISLLCPSLIFASTAGNFKREERERLLSNSKNQVLTDISTSIGLQHWIPPKYRQKNGFNRNITDRLTTTFGSKNPYVRVKRFQTNSSTEGADLNTLDGVNNALGPGQDPSPISRIESDGQRHYYFPTVDFNMGVYMQTSTNLNTVLSHASNEYSIFNFTTGIGTEAPSLYEWDANNYLLYISSIGADGKGFMYVLQNDGQDLLTGWQNLGPVRNAIGDPIVNYDAFAFSHPNGNHYLLYSALNSIQIAPLTGFVQLGYTNPNQDLSTTIVPFTESNIVFEAPGAIVQGNTLNVYYSQNGYFTAQYNTVNIAIPISANPLDPASWQSVGVQSTVLQSSNQTGVYGPGSGGTFIGPDDQPWFAYTCFYNPNGFDPGTSNPRRVQGQPLSFNKNDELIEIIPDKPVRYNN